MIWLPLLILAILFAAVLTAAESGIFILNRLRLRTAVEQGRRGARFLFELSHRPGALVVAAFIGVEIAIGLAGAAFALWLDSSWLPASAIALLAIIVGILPFDVLGRRLPVRWMERTCDWSMYRVAGLLRGWVGLCERTGLLRLLARIQQGSRSAVDANFNELAEARLVSRLRESAAQRELTTYQREMLDRFMNLSHIRVSSVMIPRARSATLSTRVSRDDFLRVAKMAHFSRIPVYDTNPRRIIGIVNVYDVLTDTRPAAISEYVQPVIRLSMTESVATALLRLRQSRQSMAIVQDRVGNCEGVLTVKDLVEEIVGELEAW